MVTVESALYSTGAAAVALGLSRQTVWLDVQLGHVKPKRLIGSNEAVFTAGDIEQLRQLHADRAAKRIAKASPA